MIYFVYAQDLKGGIGYQNALPWNLPSDMAFFKKVTMGHTIVMGRKTFESMDQRLLPGRKTLVVTRQEGYGKDIPGLLVAHNRSEILSFAEKEDLYVIGGAHIFDLLKDDVDVIIRTLIKEYFPADVYMADIDSDLWQLEDSETVVVDENNPYEHVFETWVRSSKDQKG